MASKKKDLKKSPSALKSELTESETKLSKAQKRLAESETKLGKTEKRLAGTKTKLAKAEKRVSASKKEAEWWKREAKAQRKSAARAESRVDKLRKKLRRGSSEPAAAVADVPTDKASSTPSEAEPAEAGTMPDESWTVTQLKAEARAQGLVGMSNKSKAELLDALS